MTEEILTLAGIKMAIRGKAAAFRCVTKLQPAGGKGDKVFPPTYKGGEYAVEQRVIEGQTVQCVLLDSVQSQANRMELALLEAKHTKKINLPLITVNFKNADLKKKFVVTSLDAPHRIADAILRDSLYKDNGQSVIFRKSSKGIILDAADVRNAASLFGLCPTALLFGIWDSTGPRGGLGAKFQRAIVSEIIGINAQQGVKTSSRIDPAQIRRDAGPVFQRNVQDDSSPHWTLDTALASQDKNQPKKLGKDGKPSEANHSNIPPSIADGGFTIDHAIQTTVLSLVGLRRLRFPLNGALNSDNGADEAARTVLVALGIASATLAMEEGYDLRSRCQLFPSESFLWELLNVPGEQPQKYTLTGDAAVELLNQAIKEAQAKGLPWDDDIELTPAVELVELVKKSQELAASIGVEDE